MGRRVGGRMTQPSQMAGLEDLVFGSIHEEEGAVDGG